uniref:NADH-ubiquinone oxidoreductase chain 4 n=1 Tax=Thraustochytrium aureum TaxID=42467 RepID=Q9G4C2_9STRA|nr:NADH dehydrogenase subunit 4 [Thraustochytrium aureum]
MNYISTIIFFPFFGSLFLCFSSFDHRFLKQIGLFSCLISLSISLFIWVFFDNSTSNFQFVEEFVWFKDLQWSLVFGVDGISLFFVILTNVLTSLCLLISWHGGNKSIKITRNYYASFLVIQSLILIVFTTIDLVIFYIFFESVLIPMFIIIGIWGTRERKVRASFLFFLYTLVGSLFILLAILLIFFEVGSTNYFILIQYSFSFFHQKILWFAFFISFAVKVPILPFHIWLPEAHVEAPTAGSVMLAGILLKLGTYGFIRYSLPLFPLGTLFYKPLIYVIASVAVVYTSITALRQTDIKRVIAYASVAHINMTIIGLFSLNLVGIEGSIFQIIAHGVVSGALFICVGVLYDRYHSRLIQYYGGFSQVIPIFIFFFLFFSMANIALPGTCSFVGEFIILAGIIKDNFFITFISATSIVLGGGYSLWLFNRISYGSLKMQFISFSSDVTKKEFFVLSSLCFFAIFMGIFPSIFFKSMHFSCNFILKQIII